MKAVKEGVGECFFCGEFCVADGIVWPGVIGQQGSDGAEYLVIFFDGFGMKTSLLPDDGGRREFVVGGRVRGG